MYFIQRSFICRPSDSPVSENAGIEPRTLATSALAVRRSTHLASSHFYSMFLLLSHIFIRKEPRKKQFVTYLDKFCEWDRPKISGVELSIEPPSWKSKKCNIIPSFPEGYGIKARVRNPAKNNYALIQFPTTSVGNTVGCSDVRIRIL